ncbi:MAG TPA: hypothetical protein VM686_02505 [Polyangiaceae bacterium]|nr:hypothetical protein [Polyangiaceae bacterium]
MGKRRRSKKQRASVQPEAARRRHLIASLESLEITRGHDGLMRGKPEPVLLLAAYRVSAAVALVGRVLCRAKMGKAPPCVLPLEGAELRYDTRLRGEERFLLLMVAVEEDSGEGVAALYAKLEAPDAFALWSLSEPVPAPRSLGEWTAVLSAAPEAVPIELMVEQRHARELGSGDDFVSACAICVTAGDRQDEAWRLPFTDLEGRNQWTATVRVRIA